jgi:hypothetical protein
MAPPYPRVAGLSGAERRDMLSKDAGLVMGPVVAGGAFPAFIRSRYSGSAVSTTRGGRRAAPRRWRISGLRPPCRLSPAFVRRRYSTQCAVGGLADLLRFLGEHQPLDALVVLLVLILGGSAAGDELDDSFLGIAGEPVLAGVGGFSGGQASHRLPLASRK